MKCLGSLRESKLGQCRRRRAAAAAAAAVAVAAATGSWAGCVRSETPTEQPRPDGGPGTAARAPLQPSPLPDQHLPAPRAPNVMEARWSRAARRRSDLRRLGRAAAAGPLPAQAGGGAQERSGGRGRCCYARPAPRTRPPRYLAQQSRGPLATSFFHSQKNERGKKKKREKREEKKEGRITP